MSGRNLNVFSCILPALQPAGTYSDVEPSPFEVLIRPTVPAVVYYRACEVFPAQKSHPALPVIDTRTYLADISSADFPGRDGVMEWANDSDDCSRLFDRGTRV